MDWQGAISNQWVKLFDKVVDTLDEEPPAPIIDDNNIIEAEEF